MKVLATVSFEFPDATNSDIAEEMLNKWFAEADYVMRERHHEEKYLPTDPNLQNIKVCTTDLPTTQACCPVCDSVEVVNVLDLNDERLIYRCQKCGTKFEEKIGEDA